LSKTFSHPALDGLREVRCRRFNCSECAFHLYLAPLCISFWLNDNCPTLSLLISLMNRYNQKPFIGLVGADRQTLISAPYRHRQILRSPS
jgi:hypothetical protein